MSHIGTLIMNEIRNALENLARKGVGYINFETSGAINYVIDDNEIVVNVDIFKNEK